MGGKGSTNKVNGSQARKTAQRRGQRRAGAATWEAQENKGAEKSRTSLNTGELPRPQPGETLGLGFPSVPP